MNKNKMVATIRKLVFLTVLTTTAATAARAEESTSSSFKPAQVTTWWNGEEFANQADSFLIYSPTVKAYLGSNKSGMPQNVNDALHWVTQKDNSGKYTLTSKDGYKVILEPDNAGSPEGSWHLDISTTGTATALTVAQQEGSAGYTFSNHSHYLAAKSEDSKSIAYISQETADAGWLVVSYGQKESYDKYAELFNKVAKYMDQESVMLDAATRERIGNILAKTATGTFKTYKDDMDSLETAQKVFAATAKLQGKWFRGEKYENGSQYYIYNPGEGVFLTGSTPEDHAIGQADLWTPRKWNNGTWSFNSERNYRLYLEKVNDAYVSRIDSTSTPTTFQAQILADDNGGFLLNSFDWAQRFCIDNNDGKLSFGVHAYNFDDTDFSNCTWYFISPAQKEIFLQYNKLYYEVKGFASSSSLTDPSTQALIKNAIAMTDTCCFYNAMDVIAALEEARNAYYGDVTNTNKWWYGDKLEDGKKYYLYNAGMGTFLANSNTPSETSIEGAAAWTWNNKTLTSDGGYVVYLEKIDKNETFDSPSRWRAKVTNDGTQASTLTASEARSDKNAYIFWKYGNIASGQMCFGIREGEYAPYYYPQKDNYPNFEWILISQEQKEAYTKFLTLYNEVKELANDEKVVSDDNVLKVANGALSTADNCTYTNYADAMIELYSAKRMMLSLLGKENTWWYGEGLEANKPFYLYNIGADIFVTNETPSVTAIDEADTWTTPATDDTATFTSSNGYKIYMNGNGYKPYPQLWDVKVSKDVEATAVRPYPQSKRNSYWLISSNSNNVCFTAKKGETSYCVTLSLQNDDEEMWLFISKEQKACHLAFDSLFTVVGKYAVNPNVKANEEVYKKVISTLSTVSQGTYATYESDKELMLEAIRAAAGCTPLSDSWWYGETLENNKKYYIYHPDACIFVTKETPECKDINEAALWYAGWSDEYKIGGNTFTCDNGYKWLLHQDNTGYALWIRNRDDDATPFQAFRADNAVRGEYQLAYRQPVLYQTSNEEYYMHVGVNDGAYVHSDFSCDTLRNEEYTYYWLFISEEQKEAYDTFTLTYNEANKYYTCDELKDKDDILDVLKQAIDQAQAGTYASYTKDIVTLNAAIQKAKQYIATGIENVNEAKAAVSDATVVAIYGMDGVRRTVLGPGINILKMSDGTTVKVAK